MTNYFECRSGSYSLYMYIEIHLVGVLFSVACLASCRYTRQVIDETLRVSVLAPWGARVHEFDLQVGEFVIPKEVRNL